MDNAESGLHLSVTTAYFETVTLLFDDGAVVNIKDDQERTALTRTRENNQQGIIALLRELGTETYF